MLHESANAVLVQLGEGIIFVNLGIVVGIQELTGIVTGEAEGHLGQVVGAEAEELSLLGDLVSGQSGTGDLDHGADLILQLHTGSGDLGIGRLYNGLLDVGFSSLTSPTRGIMISGRIFQSGWAFWTLMAARMTARVCILAISG